MTEHEIEIHRLTEISDSITEVFGRLMIQLSASCTPPTKAYLQEVISLPTVFIFVAKDTDIVGTFSLVVSKIPTGIKGSIEDVVVDGNARGKKIGEKMILFAIEYATQLGITTIDLTSSPTRIAANALYQKLGFVKRETNVYRLSIV